MRTLRSAFIGSAWLVYGVGGIGAMGIGGCSPDSAGDTGQKVQEQRAAFECEGVGCGSNVPEVQLNVLDAIDLHSESPSNLGNILVEGSLRAPECDVEGTLYPWVLEEELVALSDAGDVVCSGVELLNATFDIAGPYFYSRIKVSRIEDIALFKIPEGAPSDQLDSYQMIPAYEFHVTGYTTTPDPAPTSASIASYGAYLTFNPRKPLCPRAAAWTFEEFPPLEEACASCGNTLLVQSWTTEGHFAVLARGETYDRASATVLTSGENGQPWFNIACTGSALSKMVLLGQSPQRSTRSPQFRTALLKMLTAKYCGNTSGTFPGTPLGWKDDENSRFVGQAASQRRTLEAHWGVNGAICISHSRLYDLDGPPDESIRWFGQAYESLLPPIEKLALKAVWHTCDIPLCRKLKKTHDHVFWTSYAVDHRHH